jgi:broad specificity phosphatase PhoE
MPPEATPDDTRTLILMRHGETDWNRQRRVMGSAEVSLNEEGRRQCLAAAGVLGGFGVSRVTSSPLVRAIESAAIVATELGVPHDHDPDLEEVKFGRWQGLSYEEIVGDPAYAAFSEDPLSNPTPGGETILDVQRRGVAALERAEPGERVVFVSHGDIIRATICHYLEIPAAEFRRIRIDNCGLTAITERRGRPEVKFINTLADPQRAWEPLHWTQMIGSA